MLKEEWLNILGLSDEDLSSIQWISYSYIKQGKIDIALKLLEALYVIHPHDLYTLQTLGAIYLENKIPYKALDVLEKALKLDPTNDKTRFNRMHALFALGFKKQGLLACSELIDAQDPLIKSKAEAIMLSYSMSA